MTERRSLTAGLEATPKLGAVEKDFVFGDRKETEPSSKPVATDPETPPKPVVLAQYQGRVGLTTRCRPELASAIKRISLERQANGIEPFRMQEIFEQALEEWLAKHT